MTKEKRVILNGIEMDYIISNKGELFSLKRGKRTKLKMCTRRDGYIMCEIWKDSKCSYILLHRLVAINFLDIPPKDKNQINHKDGNKANNHYLNLEWVCQSENIIHAYKNGLMKRDYRTYPKAQLNEDKILQIRKLLLQNVKQKEIAKIFNVSEQVISNVKIGKRYKGIGIYKPENEEVVYVSESFNPYK